MQTRNPRDVLVADLASYLEHLREDGVRTVAVSAATRRALAAPIPPAPAVAAPSLRRPPPSAAPVITAAKASGPMFKADALEDVAAAVAQCTLCRLHQGRTRTVPGQGNPHPELMFVGEGPGADEDRQGLAFVGKAGQLLTKIIHAMGLTREEVFIGNIVKCRPPDNRKPQPDEMDICLPYLRAQIKLLRPRIIVALGATAVHGLLGVETPITQLRGQWVEYGGSALMLTFHPSYLLHNPSAKRDVWTDMKSVLARLGRNVPAIQPARNG